MIVSQSTRLLELSWHRQECHGQLSGASKAKTMTPVANLRSSAPVEWHFGSLEQTLYKTGMKVKQGITREQTITIARKTSTVEQDSSNNIQRASDREIYEIMKYHGKSYVIFLVALSHLCYASSTDAFPSITGALSSLINGESTVTDLQRLSSLPKKPSSNTDQNLDSQSSVSLESISDGVSLTAASSLIPGKRRLDDNGDLALSASKLSRKHQAEQQQLLRQYTELMKAQLMSQQRDNDADGNLNYNQRAKIGQPNRRSGGGGNGGNDNNRRQANNNSQRQQVQLGSKQMPIKQQQPRNLRQRKQQQVTKRSDYRDRSGYGTEESRKEAQQSSLGGNIEANELERDPIFRDDDEHSDRRNSDDGDEEAASADDDDSDEAQSRAPMKGKASKQRNQSNNKDSYNRGGGRSGGKRAAESRKQSSDDDESSAADEGESSDEDSDSSEVQSSTALASDLGGPTTNSAGLLDNSESVSQVSNVKSSANDLQVAAAGHHGHHGHYYQHVEVPKKKAWKFGFKRGNHKHEIERHEKGHKHKFHSSFKWHAKEKCKKKKKCKSVGKMTWKYEHAKKKHHH